VFGPNISIVFCTGIKTDQYQATIFRTYVLPSFSANVFMSELIVVKQWVLLKGV